MRTLLAATFLIALSGAKSFSQKPQLEGVVHDSSDRPVEGARVECGGKIAFTDSSGRFTIAGVDHCRASVTMAGFETARIAIIAGEPANVSIAPAGPTERIVVSATRTEAAMEEAGVAGNVLNQADIERRQFPMVHDLLREIPGTHVAKFGRNGGSTQVFSRGAQRTGTLVLLDGVPVNDPGGDMNFAHLTSGSIERVEVVRGPQSALFGAEASAAVIQLFTRRGEPERKRPHTAVSYERGSFQTDRWMANIAGGSGERIDYSLGVDQFHTVSEFPNDFYRNTTGTANIGVRLSPATQLRGIFRSFDSAVGVPNRVAYGIHDLDANRSNRDFVASVRVEDVRGANYLQRGWSSYHRLRDLFLDSRADGPYSYAALLRDVVRPVPRVYLVRLLDPLNLPPAASLEPGTRVVTRSTRLAPLAEPSLSITSRSEFGYQGTVTERSGATVFGYEFERQDGAISRRDVDRSNHGLFLHQQWTVGGRLFLTGGARLEQNSVFRTKFTPRAAASLRVAGEHGILSSTFLRVSAGRGITEPSLLQSFAQDPTFVGNPNLRLEKTTSYEVGLVQEWFGRRLRTELAAFHNSFRDLIVFVSSSVVGTWDNVDAARARGLELSGNARVWKSISLSASYTFVPARVTRSSSPASLSTGVGQELLRRPRHAGAMTLSIAPRRWSLQTGVTFLGERQDSDTLGVTRAPGYQNVWATGSWRLAPHLTPFLRADNLLNARYQESLGYSSLSRSLRGGARVEW